MHSWRRLARRFRRLLRSDRLPAELTLEQLPDALALAISAHEVRTLMARVRPAGPHLWPAVARHAPELDAALIAQLLAQDPASAPELARNAELTPAEGAQVAVWAAERLARDAGEGAPPAYLAPAPLALERLADRGYLHLDAPATRVLAAVGRQSSEARRTHLDRDARRILLRIRDLGAADLLALTDICRSDEEALLAIARHPAADQSVCEAIIVATPRASTVERLAEVDRFRQSPELRRLLHRRSAESVPLLVSLLGVATGAESRALWLDLIRLDRPRAAERLTGASDDAISALTRHDLIALLHSPRPDENEAAAAVLRRLGIEGGPATDAEERRAG